MAMKSWCYFGIAVRGDGTSAAITLDLATAPFVFGGGSGVGSAPQLPAGFSARGVAPTAVEVISSSDGKTVSPSLGLLSAVTFTWQSADKPANGVDVTLYGRLLY